jgi:biotin carboxyl carrier protein
MATISITSQVTGSVWKVEKAVGDSVSQGEVIMILESMKMEIPVEASEAGKIAEIAVAPEDSVEEEQLLCTIET